MTPDTNTPRTAESEYEWWCPRCGVVVQPEHVTHDETHDPRACGCGDDLEIRIIGDTPRTAGELAARIESLAVSLETNGHDGASVRIMAMEARALRSAAEGDAEPKRDRKADTGYLRARLLRFAADYSGAMESGREVVVEHHAQRIWADLMQHPAAPARHGESAPTTGD